MLRATGTARAAAALFVISSVHTCVENRRADPAVKRTGVGDDLRAPTQGALGLETTSYIGITWIITMTCPSSNHVSASVSISTHHSEPIQDVQADRSAHARLPDGRTGISRKSAVCYSLAEAQRRSYQ